MKKAILINLLALSLGSTCFAKTITETTAKTIGANFLAGTGLNAVKSPDDLKTVYTATADRNGATIVDYYVFNFAGSKGFIMVSGDDAVTPVLAYSGESYFDEGNMAPGAREWIGSYQDQITYVLQNNLPASEATKAQWAELQAPRRLPAQRTTSTFPSSTYFLCNTTWDQITTYNDLCPAYGGANAPTGCVATAMAQIMKFWNWPNVGCGAHTYTPPIGIYGGQSADFGAMTYDWASMGTSLTSGNPAVATLMYHIGVSLDMQYTPSESGTYVTENETPAPYTNNAEYSFKTYFRYKKTIKGYLRAGLANDYYAAFHVPAQAPYALTAWNTLIETELNAHRPLIYKGVGGAGGHAWVCDGFDASNKMHFNFGWSGASNGYYTVDAIAPPTLGTGGGGTGNNFNSDQAVLMGIIPDSGLTATGTIKLASRLDVPYSDPYVYNAPISAIATISNTGTTAFSGSIAAQVFDSANHYVGTIQTMTGQTITAGGTSSALIFSSTGMMAMIPGQYHVRIMTQPSGSTTWTAVNNSGVYINDNLVDVRITGFTQNALELYSPISVTTGVNMLINGPITCSTKVRNMFSPTLSGPGSNFTGLIQGSLISVATGTAFTIQSFPSETIVDSSYNSYNFHNTSCTVPAGTYVFAVQYQSSVMSTPAYVGSDYYTNPVIIHVHTNVGLQNVSPADNIAVFPNPAKDVINIITDNVIVNDVTITDMLGREVVHMNPDNSQFSIRIPADNLAAGMYLAQMHTADGLVTKKIVVTK